jgi:hypothetical protein
VLGSWYSAAAVVCESHTGNFDDPANTAAQVKNPKRENIYLLNIQHI